MIGSRGFIGNELGVRLGNMSEANKSNNSSDVNDLDNVNTVVH